MSQVFYYPCISFIPQLFRAVPTLQRISAEFAILRTGELRTLIAKCCTFFRGSSTFEPGAAPLASAERWDSEGSFGAVSSRVLAKIQPEEENK